MSMAVWQGILLSLGCGLIGGIANLLINSESALMPRFHLDDEGNRHLLYGFIKPLIIGMIAGPIAVFNMYENLEWYQIAYLSIVSGIAGSATLNAIANRYLNEAKKTAIAQQNMFEVKVAQPYFDEETKSGRNWIPASAAMVEDNIQVSLTDEEMKRYVRLRKMLEDAATRVEVNTYHRQIMTLLNSAKDRTMKGDRRGAMGL